MTLSEMRQILAEGGIRLTKSLGQNFLHDANQLRRIVETADLSRADSVLEIGPGLGPLTEALLERAGEVLAIEKDLRLVKVLQARFSHTPSLELVHADALEYLRNQPLDWGDWKLVSNLPYSVASPRLVELAQSRRGPQRMVATLQSEVARRLMAQPDTPDYGLLTLLLQLDYEPRGSFKIPASCFFPEPDVDSACICLARRATPFLPVEQRPVFTQIVKAAFSQRRKMMLKLLKHDFPEPKLHASFREVPLSPAVRAEHVSLEQFVRLTERLARA